MANQDKNYLIQLLTEKNPEMLAGVMNLAHDDVTQDGFVSVMNLLQGADGPTYLLKAETAMKTLMQQIINRNHSERELAAKRPDQKQGRHMDDAKTASYLATLENMIFSLKNWQFENGKANDYISELEGKHREVLKQAVEQGLEPAMIDDLCKNKQYKDYAYLDEARIGSVKQKLYLYSQSKDPSLFARMAEENRVADTEHQTEATAGNDYIYCGTVTLNENNRELIDKVIAVIKQRYGDEKVNFAYILDNLDEFIEILKPVMNIDQNQVLSKADRERLAKLAYMISDRVMEYDKMRMMENENAQQAQAATEMERRA